MLNHYIYIQHNTLYAIINPMYKVITENINPNTSDIDIIPTIDIVKKINDEDKSVAFAIEKELPSIALAVDLISNAFLNNKKLFYFGAGTSGRLGVLDASECSPTFSVEFDMVQGIIAGGDRALRYAIEGAEDDFELGLKNGEILKENDICTLISASGNPKYLLGVKETAKKKQAKIIAVTSNPNAKILKDVDVRICPILGPEVITGSSRMKSGTAQKMILNMLTTASMVQIGKTYKNYMIDVKPTNEKLRKRALEIVKDITNKDEKTALEVLNECDWNVKTAVLMIEKNISKQKAKEILAQNKGVLRRALNK